MKKSLFLVALLAIFYQGHFFTAHAALVAEGGIDYEEIGRQLEGDGIEGWMHAIVKPQGLYLFTYRDPKDFFVNAQFPLVSHIPEVMATIEGLKRHDKIRIKGKYIDNGSPQRHIYVTAIQVITKWDQDLGEYNYDAKIPEDLLSRSSLVALVHAVDAGGRILVIEYKDAVLPVYVSREEWLPLTSKLYRGDKIELNYVIRREPGRPTHISPNRALENPIKVLDRIALIHGIAGFKEGILVKFPKSPQIVFDVYALQVTDEDHVSLQYTLVNFEDQEVFAAIRAKLAAAWDAKPDTVVNGRNKLVNPKIKVRAQGTFNLISPNQANPQILLSSPDALTITVEE